MAKGPAFPNFSLATPAPRIAAEVLRALYDDVRKHAAGTLQGEDPDAVHDMRVAVRRLRSMLDLFEPLFRRAPYDRTRRRLRKLARALGRVRDADVHLAALRAHRTGATLRESPGVTWLIERTRAERAAAARNFSERYREFATRVGSDFTVEERLSAAGLTLGATLPAALAQREKRHRRLGVRALKTQDATDIHRYRIGGKQVRYTLEVFSATLGSDRKKQHKALCDLQDVLGQITDANIFIEEYGELADAMPPNDPRRFGLYSLIAARTQTRRRALESWAYAPTSGTTPRAG